MNAIEVPVLRCGQCGEITQAEKHDIKTGYACGKCDVLYADKEEAEECCVEAEDSSE